MAKVHRLTTEFNIVLNTQEAERLHKVIRTLNTHPRGNPAPFLLAIEAELGLKLAELARAKKEYPEVYTNNEAADNGN